MYVSELRTGTTLADFVLQRRQVELHGGPHSPRAVRRHQHCQLGLVDSATVKNIPL
jgi:hypothetical protein